MRERDRQRERERERELSIWSSDFVQELGKRVWCTGLSRGPSLSPTRQQSRIRTSKLWLQQTNSLTPHASLSPSCLEKWSAATTLCAPCRSRTLLAAISSPPCRDSPSQKVSSDCSENLQFYQEQQQPLGNAFILVFSISSRQSLEELKPVLELINEVRCSCLLPARLTRMSLSQGER